MKDSVGWVHQFKPYTATHACVVLAFLLLVALMVAFRKTEEIATVPPRRRIYDKSLGWVGLSAAIFVQVVTLRPSAFSKWTSLPLHVCDLAMFIAPGALILGWRPLRAIAYFWGLGLSSLSFIIPDLSFGPGDFQFWVFWMAHATIVGTALYDITARHFRPKWGDFFWAAGGAIVYVAIMFPIDVILHFDYGYIGKSYPGHPSFADALGPWPIRVPMMLGMAITAMFLLELPWAIYRRARAKSMANHLAIAPA